MQKWRDFSHYNGILYYDKMIANDVRGVALKASEGLRWKDKTFPENWEKAGKYDLYRTGYHYFRNVDVNQQVRNFFEAMPEIDIIPRVIDFEIVDKDLDQVARRLWKMVEAIEKKDGVKPIIYTRASLIKKVLLQWSTEQLNSVFWWLAQYNSPVLLKPKVINVNNILWWQHSEHLKYKEETSTGTGCSDFFYEDDKFIDKTWGYKSARKKYIVIVEKDKTKFENRVNIYVNDGYIPKEMTFDKDGNYVQVLVLP